MAKGEIFVVQGKTNPSGLQTAKTATKAVSDMGMMVKEDNPEGFRG